MKKKPMSAAERQRRYRERALSDPDGLLMTRLQVMLSAHPNACLERICEKTGKMKREVVEQAIIELARTLECDTE
jgi:hypothetical protein